MPTQADSLAARLRPGTKLKQYELVRELGRGGMGLVFQGRDLRLGRKVAIKFLTTGTGHERELLLREARATARLNHENIVSIFEADELDGRPFLVLEFLEGENLRALSDGRKIPEARAVDWMIPVVRALVHAHEASIIHRDLKPENIFVASTGAIKVLDFGIAKLGSAGDVTTGTTPTVNVATIEQTLSGDDGIVGTVLYMAPEQFGLGEVDARADLWAVGVILFELLAGEHPLGKPTAHILAGNAVTMERPMPRLPTELGVSPALSAIVARCLEKRKSQRFGNARELLEALLAVAGRAGTRAKPSERPYLGLSAFDEADAPHFFGRTQDVRRALALLDRQALLAITGPSGVGKSSFVRAGIVPALKASGRPWQVIQMRPGRNPIETLARAVAPDDAQAFAATLREAPGALGEALRERARESSGGVLLYIDQFEELFTQVSDQTSRRAFVRGLLGAVDDLGSGVRIVVTMRADFFDRAGEDREFFGELVRNVWFLDPLGAEALREALVAPAEALGGRFESPALVERMVSALASTEGALPLLQFTAARLWDARDVATGVMSAASYDAIGGLAGAMATYADQVVATLSPPERELLRAVFVRLVTPDGTRAQVDARELEGLSSTENVRGLIERLVNARLLSAQAGTGGTIVELLHEALIEGWPTLKRWVEEGREDLAFLSHLRASAAQWDARGRPVGLLWRDEAEAEARRFKRRFEGALAPREEAFLDGAFAVRRRKLRVRALVALGVALIVGLGWVGLSRLDAASRVEREIARKQQQLAEQRAEEERKRADEARSESETERRRAEAAAQALREKQAALEAGRATVAGAEQRIDEERRRAEEQARRAQSATLKASSSEQEVDTERRRNDEERRKALEEARRAREAQSRAEKLSRELQETKTRLESMLAAERARSERLERERKKISKELK